MMFYSDSFNLNGFSIKTTVTNEDVNYHISRFLSPTNDYNNNNNKTMIFGFDTEWFVRNTKPDSPSCKCAIILCDGKSCLIIHLKSNAKFPLPESLINILRHPNYIFVGFGIKDNVAMLEKEYGFRCRNAVELGPLAACLMQSPRLSYCGVDELASVVCKLDLQNLRPVNIDYEWGKYEPSKQFAKVATINVYSYHKIGIELLVRD